MIIMKFIALLICAYLLGSIPWGLILARIFAGADIRQKGSGNIGATNVTRQALELSPTRSQTLVGDEEGHPNERRAVRSSFVSSSSLSSSSDHRSKTHTNVITPVRINWVSSKNSNRIPGNIWARS